MPLRAADGSNFYDVPRKQDEIWLVSCRNVGCGTFEQQAERLQVWHYDRAQSWVRATLAELLATDDTEQVSTVFIHGNRIPFDEAFTKGWNAYRALVRSAGPRGVRFIIWSWPSEPIRGLVNDARTKAARTDPCGYQLGWFLDQLNPDVPVSLWAHSFGVRIATGALNLLGGGTTSGQRLSTRVHPNRQPMEVVFLAAALDSDWLLPGHRQGRAMSQVDGMLLVNNSCDALLKRYELLYGRRSCVQALGYTGLTTWLLAPADRAKVRQRDACCQVGRQHTFVGYLESPDLVAEMRPYLLFERHSQTSPAPPSSQDQTPNAAPELLTP
ncbi:MAG TPA: alpha/beta hydrolase [Pirellulales bacterium]|nr:alpha/beta hydrolase [Pirellulales bacterium]